MNIETSPTETLPAAAHAVSTAPGIACVVLVAATGLAVMRDASVVTVFMCGMTSLVCNIVLSVYAVRQMIERPQKPRRQTRPTQTGSAASDIRTRR